MTDEDRENSGWTPEKNEAMQQELLEALSKILQKFEACMVTKYVVLVETVDEQGQRGLWTCESEGMVPWESLGLVEYARQVVQARVTWRETPAVES